MKTFTAFVIALVGAITTAILFSMVLFSLIYGERRGDSSGNWGLYPVVVLFFASVALMVALAISFPLFRRFCEPHAATIYSAVTSGACSAVVALIMQAFGPDSG